MVNLLLFILAGFGITTIITKGDIFEPFRNMLDNGSDRLYDNFLGLLIVCPMCVGFWVGIVQSIFIYPLVSQFMLNSGIHSTDFLSSVFYFFQVILSTIMDGAIVGGVSWSIHMLILLIKNRAEYYDTKALYYMYLAQEDEKEKLDNATKRELLND